MASSGFKRTAAQLKTWSAVLGVRSATGTTLYDTRRERWWCPIQRELTKSPIALSPKPEKEYKSAIPQFTKHWKRRNIKVCEIANLDIVLCKYMHHTTVCSAAR